MSFPFLLLPFLLKARDAQAEVDKKLHEKTLINLSCSRQVSIRLFNHSLYGMKLTFSTHRNASREALNCPDAALDVSALVAVPTCTFIRRIHASRPPNDLSVFPVGNICLERVGGSGRETSVIGSTDGSHCSGNPTGVLIMNR